MESAGGREPARGAARAARSALAGLALLAVAAAAGGCLFQPREPETPGTGTEIEYLPRTRAGNVWENCRLSMVNTDVTGWDNAIVDPGGQSPPFRYVPDTQTRDQFPAVDWDNWGKEQEMTFITNWYNSNVRIQADLLNETFSTPEGSGNLAEWDIIYYVQVTDRQTGSITKYRGRAILEFRLESTWWYLTFWRDEGGESDPDNPATILPTLGVLRGTFAN